MSLNAIFQILNAVRNIFNLTLSNPSSFVENFRVKLRMILVALTATFRVTKICSVETRQ